MCMEQVRVGGSDVLRAACLPFVAFACVLFVGCGGGCGPRDDGVPPAPTPPRAPAQVDVMRRAVLAGLGLRPGMVLAEIGLGRGWFVLRAREPLGRQGRIYATDVDREAIDFMRRRLPRMNPDASPVELRLCRHPRDTGLDDLADDSVDVITMIDSLCFDGTMPHDDDVAYLRRFHRILRPGGRLVHHMDCGCRVTPEAVTALFVEAGFTPNAGTIEIRAPREPLDPTWACRRGPERARDLFVGVYGK